MRIWFDLTNSPHVNFFADLVEELRPDHEILITCRPLANTVELLDLKGLPYHIVGRHYGASKVRKAAGFCVRVLQLARFLRGRKVDIAISHSSFYSPIVSRMLRIPCIYLNDNEHADGNRISFLFADLILIPEFLPVERALAQGGRREKFVQYPGVKEGIYLWKKALSTPCRKHSPGHRAHICIRPEPWTAQYYKGRTDFMDPIIAELGKRHDVLILPRGNEQRRHYADLGLPGVTVQQGSLSIDEIMGSCDLFIGAGGTMTREAAVLGIPTISVYQDELLEVDRYLIAQGCMVHRPNLDVASVEHMLDQGRGEARTDILEKGQQAYELIRGMLTDPSWT